MEKNRRKAKQQHALNSLCIVRGRIISEELWRGRCNQWLKYNCKTTIWPDLTLRSISPNVSDNQSSINFQLKRRVIGISNVVCMNTDTHVFIYWYIYVWILSIYVEYMCRGMWRERERGGCVDVLIKWLFCLRRLNSAVFIVMKLPDAGRQGPNRRLGRSPCRQITIPNRVKCDAAVENYEINLESSDCDVVAYDDVASSDDVSSARRQDDNYSVSIAMTGLQR